MILFFIYKNDNNNIIQCETESNTNLTVNIYKLCHLNQEDKNFAKTDPFSLPAILLLLVLLSLLAGSFKKNSFLDRDDLLPLALEPDQILLKSSIFSASKFL